LRHPGTPILYNTDLPVSEGAAHFRARFGVERIVKRQVIENGQAVDREDHDNLLAEGLIRRVRNQGRLPEFTLGVLKKLGWDKDLTAQEMEIIRRVSPNNPKSSHGQPTFPAAFSAWRSRMAVRHTVTPRRA